MKTKEELRLYFKNGDIPRQEDFWEWQNSYWHKSEKLSNSSLEVPVYDEFIFSPTDNTEVIGIGKRIVFPEGIKVIGEKAFMLQEESKNYITHITLPNTLEKIKPAAIALQHLRGILRIPGSCKLIDTDAFTSTTARISELIIENGVEIIEEGAFQFSQSNDLTSLEIPDSVKYIGTNAFGIPSLQTIIVPAGLDISDAGFPSTAIILERARS